MPSRPKLMISVDVAQLTNFQLPVPIDSENPSDTGTVFYVATADDEFAIYGSYDELLTFASNVMAAAYSWPILNGHVEWLGDDVKSDQESGENGVTGQDGSAGPGSVRGDSATTGGVCS